MNYFFIVTSMLGQAAPNGAVIELTGQSPRVIYGQLDASDSLTLTRNASEDKLVCSGEFEAADLRIAGTSTTVADLIGHVADLRRDLAAVKQFVGMMPPASPPPQVSVAKWSTPINTLGIGISYSSNTQALATTGADKAFDGINNNVHDNHWHTAHPISQDDFLQIAFSQGTWIAGYSFTSRSSFECCWDTDSPHEWVVYGSHDAASWTEMQAVTAQFGWGAFETRQYEGLARTEAFRYYRWTFPTSATQREGIVALAEVQLFPPL